MSASFTDTHTCILFRSRAIRNRLGAFMLAFTVCPIFTRRSMITPSTGEAIVQYSILRFALERAAVAAASCAFACFTFASASASAAFAELYSEKALSDSLFDMIP